MLTKLYRAPYVGLIALLVGFLTQPLGHTAYTLILGVSGEYYFPVAIVIGLLGMVLVWKGLDREEVPATWMGMLGGWLIWIGFFEFSFKFYGQLYNVPHFVVEENGYKAGPSANILQASLTSMLALFVLYGMFNRQTKCNLMRWVHRATGMNPGMPTNANGRSFARITAMEVLFVTWFCYLFWLYMIYFGTRGAGAYIITAVFAAWTIWSGYLIYRCTKQTRIGPSLRYGIGTGIVLWGVAEMPSHFGAYPEVWLKPFDYPVFCSTMLALFGIGLAFLARGKPAQRA